MADETTTPPQAEASGDSLGGAAGVLGDALGQMMRVALRRGRTELGRAAVTGRQRLELRQLRQDKKAMLRKLGAEVVRLVEAGELDHPGLVRGAERLEALNARLTELEERARAEAADEATHAGPDVEETDGT